MNSVTPIYDGFMVVPEPIPLGAREQDRMRFAVVYVQSPLRPSIDGTLVYRGAGGDCNGETGECFDLFSRRTFNETVAPVPRTWHPRPVRTRVGGSGSEVSRKPPSSD